MKEIALLGGSFDPPHVGHLMAAWYVLATEPVAEVWLLPSFRHPFGKVMAPFSERVEMCERAAASVRGLHVCRAEAELEGDPLCGATARTLEHLAAKHADRRFALVIGTDLLPETGNWYRWDLVEARARIVVVGRQGHPEGAEGRPLLPEVSSTEVRQRLARGEEVSHLVPRRVVEHIRERGLYRG